MENPVILEFKNANDVTPQGVDFYSSNYNFYLGNRGTFTNVNGFKKIVYNNLWSGIDLIYKITSAGLKYEFRVNPGASPSDIEIEYSGHDRISIGKKQINLFVGENEIIDDSLLVYQVDIGEIEANFIVKNKNSMGFKIGKYNAKKTLIIDPLVVYSVVFGGDGTDVINSALISNDGIYTTGYTESPIFIDGDNYINPASSNRNCFVLKIEFDGGLAYSAIIGGSDDDEGNSIDVNNGIAYVTGSTLSINFPSDIWSPTDTELNDPDNFALDCFVLALETDGTSLEFIKRIGKAQDDNGTSICFEENLYVLGQTTSDDFPTTPDAFNKTNNGVQNCFVLEIDPNLHSLLYSTYLGGNFYDYGTCIEVIQTDIYITGYTKSDSFPLLNEIEGNLNGVEDCLVVKLYDSGREFEYSTYLGGSENDRGYSIVVRGFEKGYAYITGTTNSDDFPMEGGGAITPHDHTYNGEYDCFIAALNSGGNALIYSTYAGGSNDDIGKDIDFFSGLLVVVGSTESEDFPIDIPYVDNPIYESNQGGWDCFILAIDPDRAYLKGSLYIGSSGNDFASSFLSFEPYIIGIGGYTNSIDFPVTTIIDETYGSDTNCFIYIIFSVFSISPILFKVVDDFHFMDNPEDTTPTLSIFKLLVVTGLVTVVLSRQIYRKRRDR